MKKLIVCDSGLGGLDIAAPFFRRQGPCEWDLIYLNAFPDPKFGYNDLAESSMREAVFQSVLESMESFSPALCMIACNTLSIVWRDLSKRYRPSFPVMGIIDRAVEVMTAAARTEPEAHLLILGTETTVFSGVYPAALRACGVEPERIHSLACPGLARQLEKDPLSPEVSGLIGHFAAQADALFARKPEKIYLCFCCTHYGYAERSWKREFGRLFPAVGLINPNRELNLPGRGGSFAYHSRLELGTHQRAVMSDWFAADAPPIAEALRNAKAEPDLFLLPEGLRRTNNDSFLS